MPENTAAGHEWTARDVHQRVVELASGDNLRTHLEEALTLIDPAVIDHRGGIDGDHHGIAAWRQKWERMIHGGDGFHDVSVTVDQNVTSGDTSANRYTIRGTHSATGRQYEVLGLDMVRVRDGRIVEHWALMDAIAVQHQITQNHDT